MSGITQKYPYVLSFLSEKKDFQIGEKNIPLDIGQ